MLHMIYFADNFMSCSKPLQVLPSTGQSVTGVATLGDELFVVRHGVKHVDVYDAATLTSRRQLALSSGATVTDYIHGMTVCATNKCVYVSDYSGNIVHKVPVDGKTPATHWSVNGSPWGLSITTNHNLLVTCHSSNKLQEYTTLGVLVREISLQSDITSPIHAIQLANGQYGVTHRGHSPSLLCC